MNTHLVPSVAVTKEGQRVSWSSFLGSTFASGMTSPDESLFRPSSTSLVRPPPDEHPDLAAAGKLFPLDSHNFALLDKVCSVRTRL